MKIILLWCALVIGGCAEIKEIPTESIFEEVLEDLIQERSGMQIDLSPWDGDPDLDRLRTPWDRFREERLQNPGLKLPSES